MSSPSIHSELKSSTFNSSHHITSHHIVRSTSINPSRHPALVLTHRLVFPSSLRCITTLLSAHLVAGATTPHTLIHPYRYRMNKSLSCELVLSFSCVLNSTHLLTHSIFYLSVCFHHRASQSFLRTSTSMAVICYLCLEACSTFVLCINPTVVR